MLEIIEIGKEYFHYKDSTKKYKVLFAGKLQIDDENHDMKEVVIYRSLYDNLVWVRPVLEFKNKFSQRF